MRFVCILVGVVLMAAPLFSADADKAARQAAKGKVNAKRELKRGGGAIAGIEQVLTDEQRRTLREHAKSQGEKLGARQQEAARLRRELQEAVLNGEIDEATIRQRSEAIARIEGELLAARMNALGKVARDLTPAQKQKIKGLGQASRTARPGLGGRGDRDVLSTPSEPAAPPPPEK